jgi:hypothetical protein
MNPMLPILRSASVMCYSDNENAVGLRAINDREGEIANKYPPRILRCR